MSRRLVLLTALLGVLATAPAASAADCAGADDQPTAANVAQVRASVLCLANAERAAAGLPALTAEPHLEAAAQAYAHRMVAEQFFDHVSPDGGTLASRLSAYTSWSTIGENLAWGDGDLATPRSAMNAWMNSAGHRANLLSGAYREMGVGVTAGAPQAAAETAATYATEFGARAAADDLTTYDDGPAVSTTVLPTTARKPKASAAHKAAAPQAAAVRRAATARAATARRARRSCAKGRGARVSGRTVARCGVAARHRR